MTKGRFQCHNNKNSVSKIIVSMMSLKHSLRVQGTDSVLPANKYAADCCICCSLYLNVREYIAYRLLICAYSDVGFY